MLTMTITEAGQRTFVCPECGQRFVGGPADRLALRHLGWHDRRRTNRNRRNRTR